MNIKTKMGIIFGLSAGLFPICVGSYNYYLTLRNKDLSFWSDVFFGENRSQGMSLQDLLYVNSHVGFTNLILTGVVVNVIFLCAIRKSEKWAWWLVVFILVWAGSNDLVASAWYFFKSGKLFPFPIFPMSLGTIALVLTRQHVFSQRVENL